MLMQRAVQTEYSPLSSRSNIDQTAGPVTFDWKSDGKTDMGLVAEEVAEVEPLLATYTKEGQIEGVKYDRIGVVLVNAVKEQQKQIEQQQKQIELLTKVVCSMDSKAAVCPQ